MNRLLLLLLPLLLLAAPPARAQADTDAEYGDEFGSALARGDFNNDSYEDLAIGMLNEDIGSERGAGAVEVLYGSASGMSTRQFWSQNTANVEDDAFEIENFGASLASGDFNGDGYDDLAIAVPGEYLDTILQAGAVSVLYGSASGLSATAIPDQLWHQDVANVEDNAEASDQFGASLAAGDFNGDGRDDLAIGVPNEGINGAGWAGEVHILYGSSVGLSATAIPDQRWHQDSASVDDVAELGDNFGFSLAAGDFNNDGKDDLAIGVPYEGINGDEFAGAVNVLYGSSSGLSATAIPDQLWHQDKASVEGTTEYEDNFGSSLAAGDFNGDGRDDLAVGVPYEDLDAASGLITDAGALHVLFGTVSGGLNATTIPDQFLTQTYLLPPCDPCGVASAPPAAASAGTLPEAVDLEAGYPNPFAASTTLRYALPEPARVRLSVYDALGRQVAVLVDGERAAGRHEAAFDGRGLPAGVYVARLEAGGRVATQRLTLVR